MALSSFHRVAALALLLRGAALAADPPDFFRVDNGRLVVGKMDEALVCECARAGAGCVAAIPKAGSEPAVFENIRALNRYLVEDCAANAVNASARVEGQATFLCRKVAVLADETRRTRVGYDLSKARNGVHVGVSLRFVTPPGLSSERARTMLYKMFDDCLEPIEAVWSRYGISLDPQFLWSKEGASADIPTSHPEIRISLEDSFGRANSEKYFFRGRGSWLDCFRQCLPDMSQCPETCRGEITHELCGMMAHEIGHTLGLNDEYADPECPDRSLLAQEANPWSIMADPFHPWEQIEYFPRHVGDVVRPLCQGTNAAVASFPTRMYLGYQPFKPHREWRTVSRGVKRCFVPQDNP
jgi:hypothetical protein